MANTERLKVIGSVREAKKTVGISRYDESIDISKREVLEELYLKLDDIEDLLIIEEISTKTETLKQAAKELEKISADIKDKIKELEEITKLVDKASNAIKGLVKIVAFAAAL